MERWRTVEGFEDYEVSDLGRVRSWKRQGSGGRRETPVLLALAKRQGYMGVSPYGQNGVRKNVCVHCLVLEAFVGPCPPDHECCHLDGQCTNNVLSNLKWGTKAENASHKILHGTEIWGEVNPLAKLTWPDVDFIRANESANMSELSRRFGVSRVAVRLAKTGRTWKEQHRPQASGRLPERELEEARAWRPDVKRKRVRRGESHPQAKLTAAKVREIRSRAEEKQAALAREFGVSPSAIRLIIDRKVWASVE